MVPVLDHVLLRTVSLVENGVHTGRVYMEATQVTINDAMICYLVEWCY